MKQLVVVVAAVAAVAVIGVAVSSLHHSGPERIARATTSLSAHAGVVDVQLVSNGRGWDSFTVVCPYETPEQVSAKFGDDVAGVPDLTLRDDSQALVFFAASESETVDAVIFDRSGVDLCTSRSWPLVSRADGRIALTKAEVPGPWTGLPPATGS